MATSLISPGVETREIDLTTIVPSVSTTEGVIAGVWRWGPMDQRVLIDSEVALVNRFGKPTNLNPETFFTAASFLAYGNQLWTTRVGDTAGDSPLLVANTIATQANVILTTGTTANLVAGMYVVSGGANNAIANGAVIGSVINSTAFSITPSSAVLSSTTANTIQMSTNTVISAIANSASVSNLVHSTIANETIWDARDGTIDSDVSWIAKYPGELGNSIRVSLCANAAGYTSSINLASYGAPAYMNVVSNSNTAIVSFVGDTSAAAGANAVAFSAAIAITDRIKVGNTSIGEQYMKITAISDGTSYGSATSNVEITSVAGNTGIISNNTTDVVAGMVITAGNSAFVDLTVASVTNSTHFVVTSAPGTTVVADEVKIDPRASISVSFDDKYTLATDYTFMSTNTATQSFDRYWEFWNFVDIAPGQSQYQIQFGNNSVTNDEVHVVVVDEGGKFSGVPGTVLETYEQVSLGSDSKTSDGGGNFWKDVINQTSTYVWIANDISGATSNTVANLVSPTLGVNQITLKYGNDGADEANLPIGEVTAGYDLYKSAEDIADVSLIMQGKARGFQLANYLTDNICEVRKDCIALISPQKGDVVGNPNSELASIRSFRNNLRSTSYGVLDSGYKYMYDRYNDIYRWVPLNGDTAGLCVRTDRMADPWWSPAGFNRGQIKNIVKLAWNPRQAQRDDLYKNGINPIVTFPGQGTVMYGDKTLLAKPSAFDRINVRRLFIVLEKAISKASKYTLFEFNDDFTRLQFKNLVVPYLRDVQGRRGVTDFLVVCDGSNNTAEVIDRNEFIGDIYIKPARSINFIRLNFIAVRTGVAFSEIVGKF